MADEDIKPFLVAILKRLIRQEQQIRQLQAELDSLEILLAIQSGLEPQSFVRDLRNQASQLLGSWQSDPQLPSLQTMLDLLESRKNLNVPDS